MKAIILHSNLTLSKAIMNNCFEKHKPNTLFIDCNGKPALKELQNMKFLDKANTVFLHDYPNTEITDQVLRQFAGKQLVFSTLERPTPAKVLEFELHSHPSNGIKPSKTLVSIYASKLTALININFIPEICLSHKKMLQDYYNGILSKADLKLSTFYKKSYETYTSATV